MKTSSVDGKCSSYFVYVRTADEVNVLVVVANSKTQFVNAQFIFPSNAF